MSNGRLPWFRCRPDRLLGALAGMKPDRGYVYTVLLMRIYENSGPIAETAETLSRRTGLTEKRAAEALEWLVQAGKLQRLPDGRLDSDTTHDELLWQDERSKQATKAGKTSAEKRGQKPKQNQGNGAASAQQQLNHKDKERELEPSPKGLGSNEREKEKEKEKVELDAARANAGFCREGKPALPAPGEPEKRSTVAPRPPPQPLPVVPRPSKLDLEIETLEWGRKSGQLTAAAFEQACEEARQRAVEETPRVAACH